jgi:hypothetical protein
VELLVDGTVVRTDQPPSPVPAFTVTQTWRATAGTHTIGVRAYNTNNQASIPTFVTVAILAAPPPAGAPTVGPTETATALPPTVCTDNSVFVADVTIPDGTVVNPGQAFTKVWRVRNSGTCAWNANYLLTFVGGEAMTRFGAFQMPYTPPGATVDLPIDMVAPSGPGTHTGLWRIENPSGVHFGTRLSVVIQVIGAPAPAPTPTIAPAPPVCSGTPIVSFFSASPSVITVGQSATLSWGFVGNADRVEIDQGIGGVATPGNITVTPGATTTYTLTAFCGLNTAMTQVTITVLPLPTATPTLTPTPAPPTPTRTPVPPTPTRTPAPPTATPTATSTPTRAAPVTVGRCALTSESGTVSKTGTVLPTYQAGDDESNNSYRAFFSYDIADLAHKSIDAATLVIGPSDARGNPFSLGPLDVETVGYTSLSSRLYDAPGILIAAITSGPTGQYDIRSAVQTYVNAGEARFQIRLRMDKETNNNNGVDMFTWSRNTVCISITYR